MLAFHALVVSSNAKGWYTHEVFKSDGSITEVFMVYAQCAGLPNGMASLH